jgi:tetratricopeptide (TPR) repeat protein
MSEATNPDVEHVRKLVAQVDGGAPLDGAAREQALDTLEQYECWGPFFRLVKRGIQDPTRRHAGDFVRLARVQNLYLEDVFAAAETAAALVQELKLSYPKFVQEVLPQVVEFEDFNAEATILSSVCDRFPSPSDHVACLERLCMLYEKKTHNEAQLNKTYEKLLDTDKRNVKALRYFKLVYTQGGDWEEVVGILRTLLSCVTHPQELFRVAQELAAIHLYQLDQAEDAVRVLETHCADSPLDTSTIMFDAYQRLANWHGCLKVLRQCLLTVDDEMGRAILHFKIASLHEQLQDLDQALDQFSKAAKLWPQLLDAIEGVINVAVLKKDWAQVHAWLGVLIDRCQDEKLNVQLKQAMARLKDGMDLAARA